MAGFLPPAVFEIKAIADEAIAKFKDVNKELDKMGTDADKAGGKISGLDNASKTAMAGVLALGAAFVGFAAYGIKEATEAEQVMLKLGTTMSNVGVNTDANRKQVDALTESYIQLGFADEDAAAGLDVLLRNTGDLEQSQKLLAVSADYARVKHISLADASGVVAKANMGSAKAFREMGITLDTTLPKAEAIKKAMGELSDKIGGQATAYTKTFAGQMAVMKEEFNNTAETLGTALLPILKTAMEYIRNGIKFVKDNSTAFKIFGGILLTVVVALASYNVAVKTQMALSKAWLAITTVQKMAMAALTGQQLALNTAMELNPIGLIVMAVVALIAVFVVLWNKFEGFRKGVIAVGKAGLMAFASVIPIIGQVGEAIMKFTLTPLKLLLSALSHLPGVGKFAKAGLDLLNKGLDGVSDFANKAADKATSLAKNLDKLNKPIKVGLDFSGGGVPDLGNNGKGGNKGGGLTAEEKAAIKKNNEDYMKEVKSLQDKVSAAKTKFNEALLKADTEYTATTNKLIADANEKIAQLDAKAAEEKLKLAKERDKKIADAQNKFNEEMAKLNAKKEEDLAKAASDNAKRIADITQAGQDKLRSIVQQSIDRLRDAFKKGTEFNVSDLFKGLAEAGTQSAQGLLDALKTKLNAAKELAANAARLQAQGFSQTFIEQVVAAGPEVGNQLAKSLQDASPETIKELQATYADMETLTNTGLNSVATAMNQGGKLATQELNDAYTQAQKDLADSLAQQAKDYADAQAEINKTFNANMTEAEKTRDAAIADAKASYNEAIAAVDKELQDSIAAVVKDLNDGLKKAHDDLVAAQDAAQKELSDSLTAIQKEFDDKLGKITDATNATIKAINALKTAMAGVGISATTPITTPVIAATVTAGNYINGTTNDAIANGVAKTGNVTNITQTFIATKVDATDVAPATASLIKYGNTVVPTTTTVSPSKLKQMEMFS